MNRATCGELLRRMLEDTRLARGRVKREHRKHHGWQALPASTQWQRTSGPENDSDLDSGKNTPILFVTRTKFARHPRPGQFAVRCWAINESSCRSLVGGGATDTERAVGAKSSEGDRL